jgi:hypothetical protein
MGIAAGSLGRRRGRVALALLPGDPLLLRLRLRLLRLSLRLLRRRLRRRLPPVSLLGAAA